ncbi:MAG: hypothetical protein KBA86_07470 [Bacteroidales bacterium]|nr:hypothetical protein [Bacteroidales bacterium]
MVGINAETTTKSLNINLKVGKQILNFMKNFKSKIIIAVMLIMGITVFVGCSKEESTNFKDSESANFSNSFKSYSDVISKKYLSNNKRELTWYEWGIVGVADATGAYEGAKLAAPLYPPWGSIAGGLIIGAAASYTTYIGLGGDPPTSVDTSNNNNPFNGAGVGHNLASFMLVSNEVIPNNSEIYNSIKSDIYEYTDGNVTCDMINEILPYQVYENTFTLNNPLVSFALDSNGLYNYLINFATEEESEILTEYFCTSRDIGNVEGCTSYSIQMENYIYTSNLSDSIKMRLLVTMSVFRNSINFWIQ